MSAKPPISSNPTPFLPGLSPVAGKQLTAARDAGNLSSNGGALLLREAALRLGLAQVIAGPLADLAKEARDGAACATADVCRLRLGQIGRPPDW